MHPPAHRLDALAAGDENEEVSAHVASCDACASYVASLRDRAVQFRATGEARAFVARVQSRTQSHAQARARLRWSRASWVVAPVLAAAAALLLFVRARPRPTDEGTAPLFIAPSTNAEPRESHFKGGLAVVTIRQRDGVDERLVGPFTVRAGDRIRVEVSTDRDQPLAAGLLADDGEWGPLLAPTALEAGTYYSELAARFDGAPTRATLLVGAPDDVDRARRTREFTGVIAWRVTSELP